MSQPLRVIFAGTPEFSATALAQILAAGHAVPLVLTQPDRPAGRGMKLQASAVKQLAVQHNIPVAQPLSLRLDGKYPDDAAAAQAAIDWTVSYVKDRKVFGQPVGQYQNTRYTLAELQTEVQVARVFVDKCCELLSKDQLDTATASMAKYWCSDLQCKVMDECVQLHGGYGYMWEYPITRAYADARVQRIYGGTNEIMKEVISRSMGLAGR